MAAILNIPTDSSYYTSGSYNIEGTLYIINFFWNYRSGWFANLYNDQKEPILTGSRVMRGAKIFPYTSEIKGDLVCMDTTGVGGDEVTQNNFGADRRFQIWYFSEGEYESTLEAIADA